MRADDAARSQCGTARQPAGNASGDLAACAPTPLTSKSRVSATSFAGVQCGNGWAGASYASPQAAGAALLKAQGGQWVHVDRGASCNDPSIPPAVHVYRTVS